MSAEHKKSARRLISLSMPAPDLEPQQFLQRAIGQERFYWRQADTSNVLAGFGVAAELIAWGKARFGILERQARRLFAQSMIQSPSTHALPRLFGGFSFREDFLPDHTWSVFHPAHFILPHFQLTQSESESWLTINATVPNEEDFSNTLKYLWQALEARYQWLMSEQNHQDSPATVCIPPVHLRYPMPRSAWNKMIEDAVGQIQAGKFRKVVLARACEIDCGGSIQVSRALALLDNHYPGCFRFLFEPQPQHAFLGATPELLVRVSKSHLVTMALAGSIRRGNSPEEDDRLATEMLTSDKERFEHRMVVEALRLRLQPRASQLSIPIVPDVLRFHNIQHLHTPVQAELRKPIGALRLLASLHPTPALGGSPRNAAMEYIRQAEPVPRGWYAAPIGWLGPDLDGEFAVAIRSAVVQEKRAWLYAGAGIVAGSQAAQEWNETGLKFRPILQALGVEGISEG